ncbi:MAG: hypothetical protein M3418_13220 [Gemmatimonadota bacterium]|nr:hypothetical protein [Gemmatimonadota bacterium]
MSRRYDNFRDRRWHMMPQLPLGGWYPGTFWGAATYPGWDEWGWMPAPYVPIGYGAYDYGYTPRRRPEESPTYGRGADRAVRRWAQRYGYDIEYGIQPRTRPSRPRPYDRSYRRRG